MLGKRNGHGSLYKKAEGYRAKEVLVYRGGWKNDIYHGQGTLFWATGVDPNGQTPGGGGSSNPPKVTANVGTPKEEMEMPSVIHFVGRFRKGVLHGRGMEFDERGDKVCIIPLLLRKC